MILLIQWLFHVLQSKGRVTIRDERVHIARFQRSMHGTQFFFSACN